MPGMKSETLKTPCRTDGPQSETLETLKMVSVSELKIGELLSARGRRYGEGYVAVRMYGPSPFRQGKETS